MRATIPSFALAMALALPFAAHAQTNTASSTVVIEKAQVTTVANATTSAIAGTSASEQTQTLTALVLEGPDLGESITFENDYTQLSVGELFYLRHETDTSDGTQYYSVADPYRLNVLGELAALFVVLLFVFGGIQGARGLVALSGSFVLIFFALIPGILQGYSPVVLAIGIAGSIIIVGSYITHGFNRTTSAAVIGMFVTVVVTGVLGFFAVHAAHLSGYTSDENLYLEFNSGGAIDMVGLLYAGIMIGLLGVLYDIAIGQAVAIEELFAAGTHLTRIQIYRRGIRIGREHIGALVNTLAIAYVGASLPLLLVVQSSSYGLAYTINNEIFATEIIRILVGSIGLVLAVPITTLIASYMLEPTSTQRTSSQ